MDASPKSRKALAYALEEFTDVEITVLHVTNPIEDTYFTGEEDFMTDFEALEERGEREAEAILEDARHLADDYEVDLLTERAFGPPANTIVEFIEDGDFDQVVLGSHGRSGLARLFLGSVAEKVARRAPVPVTIVK